MALRETHRPPRSRLGKARAILALMCLAAWLVYRFGPRSEPTPIVVVPPPAHLLRQRVHFSRSEIAKPALSGRVRSEAGSPIVGARVCAFCATCDLSETPDARCALTRADGVFELGVAYAGSFRVSAAHEGYQTGHARELVDPAATSL